MVFHINPACWQHYPHDALQELIAAHPLLFPDYAPLARVAPTFSPVQRRDEPYRDPWGCVWHTSEDGITGTVTEHPLADWAAFADFHAPDPDRTDGLWPVNWTQAAQDIKDAQAQGKLLQTGLRHGHTFLQLCDIRGYQALMYDMADDDPRLRRLIAMLEEFNLAVVERYLAAGAEWMSYPEDLGMQVGPMVSPRHFRKYIRPSYQRLMRPARTPAASSTCIPMATSACWWTICWKPVSRSSICRIWSTASTGSRHALPARSASTWTSTASRSPSAAHLRRSTRWFARRYGKISRYRRLERSRCAARICKEAALHTIIACQGPHRIRTRLLAHA